MRQKIYDPALSGQRLTIVCFVSGSGTNYRAIAARGPGHRYVVFTNRPGCGGVNIARQNGHKVIELSHVPYLKETLRKSGVGKLPRNAPERMLYEQELSRLIEERIGKQPDLVCLAGYDQWVTDWLVDRYYPRMLNVHPGDTTRGYDGLHWVPSAKAILAGDNAIRSTLFFVDKGEDTGPVLAQSAPLDVEQALRGLEQEGERGLLEGLYRITDFASSRDISTYANFSAKADARLQKTLTVVCQKLQDALKVAGDWQIYPFAVHDLIAKGRVEMDGRTVYVDGLKMPPYGWRLDEHRAA